MLLQLDSSRSNSSVATSVVIESIGFEVVLTSPQLGFGTVRLLVACSSQEILKEFITHVMKKLKLLQENGFENSLTSSAVTD